ncbi:unnamed protein product [Porites evermanni]|uniref:Fibrinogen C-terminal domain-containing protein n=1 Tax=Porites evermanni TaxID=104178 RepID=A0ABN8SC12_9CNID|nr:unnamed protein product [Porites evermanni]
MDTDGGGWTLVWSYAFTDYENFKSKANAVSPSPKWPDISADIDVPISITPPMHEHDFNALDFSLWKQLGQEIFVKSNVNNWLVCSPKREEALSTGHQEKFLVKSPTKSPVRIVLMDLHR